MFFYLVATYYLSSWLALADELTLIAPVLFNINATEGKENVVDWEEKNGYNAE